MGISLEDLTGKSSASAFLPDWALALLSREITPANAHYVFRLPRICMPWRRRGTFKARLDASRSVWIKCANADKNPERCKELQHEVRVYERLKALQGRGVPRLLYGGWALGTQLYVVVTEQCGITSLGGMITAKKSHDSDLNPAVHKNFMGAVFDLLLDEIVTRGVYLIQNVLRHHIIHHVCGAERGVFH